MVSVQLLQTKQVYRKVLRERIYNYRNCRIDRMTVLVNINKNKIYLDCKVHFRKEFTVLKPLYCYNDVWHVLNFGCSVFIYSAKGLGIFIFLAVVTKLCNRLSLCLCN